MPLDYIPESEMNRYKAERMVREHLQTLTVQTLPLAEEAAHEITMLLLQSFGCGSYVKTLEELLERAKFFRHRNNINKMRREVRELKRANGELE